jgi:hypothetical protein
VLVFNVLKNNRKILYLAMENTVKIVKKSAISDFAKISLQNTKNNSRVALMRVVK